MTAQKNQVPITMKMPETRWHLKQKNPRGLNMSTTWRSHQMPVLTRITSRMLTGRTLLRQKYGNELREALWNEDTTGQPLTKLERLTKTVKPAHEEFWNSQKRDLFIRLNEAAKKLEASQPEATEGCCPPKQPGRRPSVSHWWMCVLSPVCGAPPAEMQQGHFAEGPDIGSPWSSCGASESSSQSGTSLPRR